MDNDDRKLEWFTGIDGHQFLGYAPTEKERKQAAIKLAVLLVMVLVMAIYICITVSMTLGQ